ncbi:VHS domain-containing protein [Prochlorococcus marinus]|uniref:Possible VHS domain n=1 Tax=Prochlorococcus marinus (strain MIT 9211) TaxID=93059 RepID=A9BA32_PROM4|nr:VHS domain-containing protein [Prochlorococcus marinus]ABX08694.1 possible VHS domain [Prochlorococcus marinus str. MIT 9211]
MESSWSNSRDEWLRRTSLSEEVSLWALDSISKKERDVYELEGSLKNEKPDKAAQKQKALRREIKYEIAKKDSYLDELSLNAPSSYKLQVSVPSSLNYLMKAWAAAEGRDLSSVALQCLELGLREMKSKGSIPSIAIERYDIACEKRIALAEVNNLLEKHECFSSEATNT